MQLRLVPLIIFFCILNSVCVIPPFAILPLPHREATNGSRLARVNVKLEAEPIAAGAARVEASVAEIKANKKTI